MVQQLSPLAILGFVLAYFLLLIFVSYLTGRKQDNESFFLAGRQSPWLTVAIGMIGASLSGVTFISIPGKVGAAGVNQDFAYLQVVMGYMLGYAVIALVLMPMYYRLRLTSIYGYLEQRLGVSAYKTGAFYFLLSRAIGSSFRLYLVASVMQLFVLDAFGVPFWATGLITLGLIWVYTFRGGLRTIVWTDTLQTVAMLTAVVLTIAFIGRALEASAVDLFSLIKNSNYSQVFFFEGGWADPNNFFKQFLSGALITIVMTGLDQDMMQKNLSCRNIGEAQKNMFTFSIILFVANLLFLALGALLYIYASQVGVQMPTSSDYLYPTIALQYLPPAAGMVFILGVIAAAYSSADSTLTAMTTSFCVDFLNFEKQDRPEIEQRKIRFRVHVGFSLLLLVLIILFDLWNNDAVINQLFTAAGYTYGPLLGLFSFGMLTHLKVREVLDLTPYAWAQRLPAWLRRINLLVLICVLAPVASYLLDTYSAQLFFGFQFGFLIIALNGLLTFLGLLAISYRDYDDQLEGHPPYEESV